MVNKKLAGVIGADRVGLRSARRWGVLGVVLALAVLTVGRVSAQNLVPNPSFESYSAIPTAQGELDLAVPWTSPTPSTPDYFHFLAASSSFVGVPGNMLGNQLAVTGQAYAGFHARPTNLYREYVETPLSSPLVAGQTYLVSFYVSLADQSQWAVDKIGAYLSVGPVGPVNTLYTLPFSPQVSNPVGNYITNKLGWTLIAGQYVAAGGEDHMVIGNFLDNPSTTPLGVGGTYPFAYYYLDDVSVTLVPCVQPPSGMVSWWPADGNPNDIVDGNHGTLVGSAGYAPGVVDQAFSFTVAGDCVEVPNAANLNLGPAGSVGGDLSIDAWILIPAGSPSSTATYVPIVDKRELPNGPWEPAATGYSLFLYNGKLAFQLGDGTFFNYVNSTGPNLLAGWHHVAVTVDRATNSTTGGNLYVDGVMVLTFDPTNRPGNLTNNQPLFIGRHAGAPDTSFIGLIDEVEIFNRALSPLEVQGIFNANSAGKCKCVKAPCGMVSWWPGDWNTDDVVDGNHGTLVGTAGYAQGMVSEAFSFTVAGDCVQVPTATNLNFGPAGSGSNGDLSIDAWIWVDPLGYSYTATVVPVVDKRELPGGAWGPQSIGYFLFLYNGKLAFQLGDTLSDFYNYTSPGPNLCDGDWHHVAVTVDRDSPAGGNLYVDGALVLIFDPMKRPGDLTNSAPLFIGRHAGTSSISFIGLIDEVEIFNRALCPLEVRDIFNAKSAGKCKCCGGHDLTISTGPWTHWLITAVPSGSTMQVGPAPLVSPLPPSWLQPPATYIAWVGTPGSGTATPGTYEYEYTFCLCSGYRNVEMKFYLWADESAEVFLNGGVPLPGTPSVPMPWWSGPGYLIDEFSPGNFVVGVNTLRIVVSKSSTGPSGIMISGWIDADVGRCCP